MRILLRAHKSPFQAANAYRTLARNLIGNNVGNLAFSQAAYRLLSVKHARIDARKLTKLKRTRNYEPVSSAVATLDPAHINAAYDHVVVPMANAFRMAYVDELRALTDLVRQLTIPVVVMGVGVQGPVSGKIGPSALDDEVKAFMTSVLNRSASIGVRGSITATYLKGLGFGDDVVDVVGCPSVFMNGPHMGVAEKVDHITESAKISMNISPYIPRMGPISVDHATRYPNLMYTAQDHLTLGLMLTRCYESSRPQPPDSPTTLDHPLMQKGRVRFPLDPATWMTYLRRFDFSFGTRIHGNIMALLSGVPAFVLAHDSRTLELADYHEIPHKVLSAKLTDVDAATLYAEADWTPTVVGHQGRWEAMAAFLEKNGLRHVYQLGESPQGFDRKLAGVHFPGLVRVGGTWLTRAEMAAHRMAMSAMGTERPSKS